MGFFRKSTDQRQAVSRAVLQEAIAEAVKKFSPECQTFIDVILTDAKPASKSACNWTVQGIRFGRSNRKKASEDRPFH